MLKDLFLEAIHLNNDYTGSGMYMGLYYVTILFILFYAKEKELRVRIAYPALIMLTALFGVFPFVNKYIVLIYDQYTGARLFWILLITLVTAYGATRMVQEMDGYKKKALFVVMLVPVIFLCGVFKFSNALYHPIENEYRLPQYGLDICDTVLDEREEPKLLVPYEIAHIFRQYSTKIKLLYGENASYGRIEMVQNLEYRKACQEMDSTTPDVAFVVSLAYCEDCDFVIFDTDYHILEDKPEQYGYDYYTTIEHFDLYKKRD